MPFWPCYRLSIIGEAGRRRMRREARERHRRGDVRHDLIATKAARSMRVIVVGAGIGGLTAALTLTRAGLDVEVFEQASELHEVGAGIQISPDATRILHRLGLSEALERVGGAAAHVRIPPLGRRPRPDAGAARRRMRAAFRRALLSLSSRGFADRARRRGAVEARSSRPSMRQRGGASSTASRQASTTDQLPKPTR